MSIHSMGMAGGSYDTFIYTAPDGSQRFDREQVSRKMSEDPDFGNVMTGDELQQWLDDEISRNQNQKKAFADLIKDSCPGWSSAKFKFSGDGRTYSFYEFLEEWERRSAASPDAEKGLSVSGKMEMPEKGAVSGKMPVLGRMEVSGMGPASEEQSVTEQQLALLFEDKEDADVNKTARERWEQSFNGIAPNAPESVKQAWLDAAKRAGVDGMGVSGDGKLTHISQMMVQRCNRWQRGESGDDMLGNSVDSAIKAAESALYALEHPLEAGRVISPEKRQNMEKEKTFYLEFIKRLQEEVGA